MPPLPALPHLRTLDIELWPRDPTRPDRKDRAWGRQTERLLGGLGTVVAVGARIGVEMRWVGDWERFEREFVQGGGGWRRGVEEVGDGVGGQEGGFCRRRYEMCGGDGKDIVGVMGKEKDVVSADDDDGLVSSFGKLALSPGKDRGIDCSGAAVRSFSDATEFSIFE